MLDIVVTHYKEPWEVGRKLFDMIGLQRAVDPGRFRVTIVNDGGNRIPEECLAGYGYEIRQIDIPHGGVSKARNTGIENADRKWVMFCDFDDCFASIYSLRELLAPLDTDAYDMIWTQIIAEDYIEGRQTLYQVPLKQRFVFCHGKVYRTAFLKESDIRFREDLVFNEDSCFNAVIIASIPYQRIGEFRSDIPVYAWVRRENSVTTSGRNDEAAYGHFRRNMIVTGEYERKNDDRYSGMVTRTAYDAYYMIHGKRVSQRMKRWMLDEFAPWIAEREGAFGNVDAGTLDEIREIARYELLDPGESVRDSHELIAAWVKSTAGMYRNTQA